MKELNTLLRKIIRSKKNKSQLVLALFGLGTGMLLVLGSVQIQMNYNHLLSGHASKDSVANFLVVNKKLTDQNLSSSTLSAKELSDLGQQPFVQKMGVLKPSRFKASIESSSSAFPFYTDVSFETVPDEFIDVSLKNWQWDADKGIVPIIVPNLFLDLYNFQFSVSQNLPQLTQDVVKMLIFKLNIQNGTTLLPLRGRVVGFSDRISSLLVPESFMNWAEQRLGKDNSETAFSRVIIQIDDPADPVLNNYLKKNGLTTDLEKTRFSRYRQIIDIAVAALATTGFIMLVFALLVFSLFIQLLIASNQSQIELLFTLGISPRYLKRFLLARLIPASISITLIVLCILSILQYLAHHFLKQMAIYLSPLLSLYTWGFALLFIYIIIFIYKKSIRSKLRD